MYPSIENIKQILIRENYISEADSAAAEAVSKKSSQYVDYLIRKELLTKTLLGQALAEHYKLPFADLRINTITKENIKQIPEELARRKRVVFVKGSDKVAAIASDIPSEVKLDEFTALFKGRVVRLAYTLPEYIDDALSLYQPALETRFATIIKAGNRVAPEIVDEIIKDALTYRVSDIHFEPQAKDVIIRFRYDGALREAGRLPKENYENTLNRIKVSSGMRIDEHFAPQDGAIQFESGDIRADLRVSLVPTVTGEKIVMRVLGSYVQDFTLSDIGLSDGHREKIEAYAHKPFGMILTAGPTGSGKTTTLYSLLKLLNSPDVNVTTIEDPVEYKIDGINQIQVREAANMTFAKGLRSIVRQDPDIILVGEVRDQETAEICVNAALTGHLLLSTFHANDAATVVPRLIDMGIEPFLLASTLELVIAQRLVRRICDNCKVSLSIAEYLKQAKIKKGMEMYLGKQDTVYMGKGCNVCSNSGYKGRLALFEMLEVTPAMQELFLTSPSTAEIANLARKEGGLSMFDDGISKVITGLTTMTEVLRVVEAPQKVK